LSLTNKGIHRRNPNRKADTFIRASENHLESQKETPVTKRLIMKKKQNGKQMILQLNTEFMIRCFEDQKA
jgi:hypothetical protein